MPIFKTTEQGYLINMECIDHEKNNINDGYMPVFKWL